MKISYAALVATSLAVLNGVNAAATSEKCDSFNALIGDNSECPAGYSCNEIEDGTGLAKCEKEEYHLLGKRQTSNLVVGPAAGTNERWPVQRLATDTNMRNVWNMFLVGLEAVQAVAEDNTLSYYQMSGIHGAPYRAWGGDSSTGAQLGYCTHSSALFATWHRPYLSLLEQRINAHARSIASQFRPSTGSVATNYRNDAARVRLPYWDWSTNGGAMPAQLTQPTVTVTKPNAAGTPVRTTIPNPLYAYRFKSLARRNADFRDSRIRSAEATRRQPPSDMGSNNMAAADQAVRSGYSSRRANTYNLFGITRFNAFSNRAWTNNGSPSSFTSVESVHDEIHVVMGGRYGHMTWVEYSAFDPVFWLHHCNVDRLVAMYQAVYPNGRVEPQSASPTYANPSASGQDTINTPLRPFRKANGQFYTSNDLSTPSSIWNLRYAYPEVPYRFNGNPTGLRTFTRERINALYGPNSASSKVKRQEDGSLAPDVAPASKRTEYLCHIQFNVQDLTEHAAQIMIFLGNYSSNPLDRMTGENFVGAAASFTPDTNSMSKTVTSTVPLTEALIAKLGDDYEDPVKVVLLLKESLKWTVSAGPVDIDVSKMPSLKIGVSSAETTYDSGLPSFGEWETHYEITQNKTAGYKPKDDSQIGSTPAPKVLGKVTEKVKEVVGQVIDGLISPSGSGSESASSAEEPKPTEDCTTTTSSMGYEPTATPYAAIVSSVPAPVAPADHEGELYGHGHKFNGHKFTDKRVKMPAYGASEHDNKHEDAPSSYYV